MHDCPFCAIVARQLPASIVGEDAATLAFMDLRQSVPGHVLIVPRRHVATIYELSPDDGSAVMQMAIRIAHSLRDAFDPPGLNLWQSNGEIAGQEVSHFHLHVQPRRPHDGLFSAYPGKPPAHSPRAALDRLADVLRSTFEAARVSS
jgi:histidine triad (HIT) family protein